MMKRFISRCYAVNVLASLQVFVYFLWTHYKILMPILSGYFVCTNMFFGGLINTVCFILRQEDISIIVIIIVLDNKQWNDTKYLGGKLSDWTHQISYKCRQRVFRRISDILMGHHRFFNDMFRYVISFVLLIRCKIIRGRWRGPHAAFWLRVHRSIQLTPKIRCKLVTIHNNTSCAVPTRSMYILTSKMFYIKIY